jgi:dTDP-4-amino-4,6-dideoxygalactose transaminase
MNIPMVDLKSQYLKIKNEIDKSISNVIDNTEFINGSDVKEFKKELANYLNVKHVITCANGTDALQIAMMALDLQPGDEVISADFTFIATVETIALLKLTPVMVDVDLETFTIDPDKIEKAITPKTKAIIPVHLFGQCADMDKIMTIAEKYNLHVIEDTAQAIGSDFYSDCGRILKAGTIGHIGCTSFFPSKNLGCYGDGGAIFTNDNDLAEKISSIVNHGMKIKYYHDNIGVNSRLDSIQAAILRTKLPHLDEYNNARLKVADYYDNAFNSCKHIVIPRRSNKSLHTFHQYTIILKDTNRSALQNHLNNKGVANAIYYPVPLHAQKAFQQFEYDINGFPNTDYLCKNVLSLPMNTELDEEQLKYITDSVLEFFI